MRDRLASLRTDLGAVASAFDGVEGGQTNLGEAVVRESPGWREYGHICEAAMGAVSRYAVINRRITSGGPKITPRLKMTPLRATEADGLPASSVSFVS